MINIVTPKVTLLASTQLAPDFDLMETQPESTDAETLMVAAGRLCYRSHHRPSEATRADGDYIRRTLHQQAHWSIAEHATASLLLTGVSRSLLAELTRHRQLSFSVVSQRFVDEGDASVVMPPAVRNSDSEAMKDDWRNDAAQGLADYQHYASILARDLPRKQAREAARSLLPNAVETQLVVSGNMRAWHEMLGKREADGADAEIREVATLIREALTPVAPTIFKGNQ